MEWIKDFFSSKGNLVARFYRVTTEPEGKYEIMYDGCQANMSVLTDGTKVRIGSITYSLKDKKYDSMFCDQVRSNYFIPAYVTKFVLSYFRRLYA